MHNKVSIFWFRRDLRIEDNRGLWLALQSGNPVLPLFIIDNCITDELQANDSRLTFIYDTLKNLHSVFLPFSSALMIMKGEPVSVFTELINNYSVEAVFFNKDYEPYARKGR